MCEDIFKKPIKNVMQFLRIDSSKVTFRIFRRLYTFIIVDTTWLFFRASSFRVGVRMLKRIIKEFQPGWIINLNILSMFEAPRSFVIITASLLLLLAVDYTRYKHIDIKGIIFEQQIVFRWLIYLGLLALILLWGLYGNDYAQTQFIYFQF